MSRDLDSELASLRSFINGFSSVPNPSGSQSLGTQKNYSSIEQAREEHYRDLSVILSDELKDKLGLRKIAIWFMILIIALHFVASCVLVGVVVWLRSVQTKDILSDYVLVAIVVTLMINFLTSLGIIFKYIFSSTAETYSHIEKTASKV